MATKIKIIHTSDFLEVTPEGVLDIAASKQLLTDIARDEHDPADYELLVDFRDTRFNMEMMDLYELAGELVRHGDTFRRKMALLVLPGMNFDGAAFFETCSQNRGFSVGAFTDYEKAMRWILSGDEPACGGDVRAHGGHGR